jgi:molybdopterin-binding protein
MKISARNQLRGTVETVDLGVVTAKVGVRVGENLIESVITKQSVEELNIKVGSEVTAIIKSATSLLSRPSNTPSWLDAAMSIPADTGTVCTAGG